MANIISERTLGNVLFLQVDSNPSESLGVAAPMGSLAIILNVGDMWQKTGPSDVDWGIILAGTGVPSTISTANAEGTSDLAARSDHVHEHGNLGGGSLHAAATQSIAGFMSASDKEKLDSISIAYLKIYANHILATSFSGTPKKASVTFSNPMPDTDYTITVTSADVRVWTFESKATTGFTLNSNSNQALTGEVHWQVIEDFTG